MSSGAGKDGKFQPVEKPQTQSLPGSERALKPTSESTKLEGDGEFVEYKGVGKLKGKKILITGGEYVIQFNGTSIPPHVLLTTHAPAPASAGLSQSSPLARAQTSQSSTSPKSKRTPRTQRQRLRRRTGPVSWSPAT